MEESEFEESVVREAYTMGMKMINTNFDRDLIYARLEKSGIPEKLAAQVADDIILERKSVKNKEVQPFQELAKIKIAIGVLILILSIFFLPGYTVVPIGLILGGAFYLSEKK